jgi:hypothetical protein
MCDHETPSVSVMREVLTRKPHHCIQCRITYPAKSTMTRWNVCFDGTAMTRYVCKTCEWMSQQSEMSPFHICLDTAGSDEMNPLDPRWLEVSNALAEGRLPNAEKFAIATSPYDKDI